MTILHTQGFKLVNEHFTLEIDSLTVDQVVGMKLVSVSVSSLYRAIDKSRFYGVIPMGKVNGRLLPRWQFTAPVPEVLPRVLRALHGKAASEVATFFTMTFDQLEKLSPAEVLAGKFFVNRVGFSTEQFKIISLPTYDRQKLVLDLIDSRKKK